MLSGLDLSDLRSVILRVDLVLFLFILLTI